MIDKPAYLRIAQPTADQVREARLRAKLSQGEAASMISSTHHRQPYRTWQDYEVTEGKRAHRPIPLAIWELFLLLTDQHPEYELKRRTKPLELSPVKLPARTSTRKTAKKTPDTAL